MKTHDLVFFTTLYVLLHLWALLNSTCKCRSMRLYNTLAVWFLQEIISRRNCETICHSKLAWAFLVLPLILLHFYSWSTKHFKFLFQYDIKRGASRTHPATSASANSDCSPPTLFQSLLKCSTTFPKANLWRRRPAPLKMYPLSHYWHGFKYRGIAEK